MRGRAVLFFIQRLSVGFGRWPVIILTSLIAEMISSFVSTSCV